MTKKCNQMAEVLIELLRALNPVGIAKASPKVRIFGKPKAKPSFFNAVDNIIGG